VTNRRVGLDNLAFDVPEEFIELPTDANATPRNAAVDALVDQAMTDLDADVRERTRHELGDVAQSLADAGIGYVALTAGLIEGLPTSAQFTVGALPVDHPDAVVTAWMASTEPDDAGGRGTGHGEDGDRLEVTAVDDLPIGPATLVRRRLTVLPREGSAEHEAGVVQAFVPVQGRNRIVVFTMATPNLEHLDAYTATLGAVLYRAHWAPDASR
jgi:hypothetical protein